MKYRKAEAKEYARQHLKGLWGATLTPFTPDLRLDEAGFRSNLRHWIRDLHVDGIFVSGKQGEFFSLSIAERKRTFEIVMSPRLCARLAELPNVVAIKDTAPREHDVELTRLAGDRLLVSNPLEQDWLDNVLELGWRLFLSSPEVLVMQTRDDLRVREYTALAFRGQAEQARRVRDSLEPVRQAIRASRPVGKTQAHFKYWQELLGQVGGPVRPPLLQLTKEEKARVREAFAGCGLGRATATAAHART